MTIEWTEPPLPIEHTAGEHRYVPITSFDQLVDAFQRQALYELVPPTRKAPPE